MAKLSAHGRKYPCPTAIRTVADAEQFVAHLVGALNLAWHPDSPFAEYADTGLTRATVKRLDALADQFWDVVDEPYGFVLKATNKVWPGTYPTDEEAPRG